MKNIIKTTGDICISTIVIIGKIKFGDSVKLLQNIKISDKKNCGMPIIVLTCI